MIVLSLACSSEQRLLSRPNHIALGVDGTAFVSDFQHDRIVEFAPDGSFRWTFGSTGIGRGELWRVTALATTHDGELLVVNRRPRSADADEASSVFELVRYRDGDEEDRVQLEVPADGSVDALAETAEGTIVVADASRGALTELDASGTTVIGPFGPPLPGRAPSALTVEGDTVWVLEQKRHRAVQIDRQRELRRLEWADDLDGPRFPSALAACPGVLVVADYARHRVQRFSRVGHLLHTFVPEPESPDQPVQIMDLRADAACERVYVVDSKGDRVLVTDLNGVVLDELWSW